MFYCNGRTRLLLTYMKNLIVAFVLFLSGISTAQQGIINPVTWDSNISKVSDTEYEVVLT